MNKKISKKEIWRNTSSAFVRGMFGFRVFCMYLGLVITLFLIPNISTLYGSWIEMLQKRNYEDDYKLFDGFSFEQLSTFIETYGAILVGIGVFGLFLGMGITLWYHIGKSRCLTTVIFVKDVMACMLYVYLMCRVPIFNSLIVVWFILILFFTFVDFLIMKSIFSYRKKLEEAIFKYNDRIQKSTGYGRYMPEYQINKPKLDLSFHSADDRKGFMEQKISIDEYVKDNMEKGKSVYQKRQDVINPIQEEQDNETDSVKTKMSSKDENLDMQETEEKSTLAETSTEVYEQGDGVKVDTTLGYRRITFEDL